MNYHYYRTDVESANDLLRIDGRWENPDHITFRPGNGEIAQTNPPRFSWPYLPHVRVNEGDTAAETRFHFQLSRNVAFDDLIVDEILDSPINFRCVVDPLEADPNGEPVQYFWRVGYGEEARKNWSFVRSFWIEPDTPIWDRANVLSTASDRLVRDGSSMIFGKLDDARVSAAKTDAATGSPTTTSGKRLRQLLEEAQAFAEEPEWWWNDFPTSDDMTGDEKFGFATDKKFSNQFAGIAKTLCDLAFAVALGFDEIEASDVAQRALALAKLGPEDKKKKKRSDGDEFAKASSTTSPEGMGADSKYGSHLPAYLAICYDLVGSEIPERRRRKMAYGIHWRLRRALAANKYWKNADGEIRESGVLMKCGSHAFGGLQYCGIALMLMNGESFDDDKPVVDEEWLRGWLHFLTEVTNGFGPDEGWNQGWTYGQYKMAPTVRAAVMADVLLPELELGGNPVYNRMVEWFTHITPIGLPVCPFGIPAKDPADWNEKVASKFDMLARLTQKAEIVDRINALELARDLTDDPVWPSLIASLSRDLPAAADAEPHKAAVFPDIGWAAAGTHSPNAPDAFSDGTGVIFQSRPRGRVSHSFSNEGDFFWYANGKVLTAGAHNRAYEKTPNSGNIVSFCRPPLEEDEEPSRQTWMKSGNEPYIARIIAWREGETHAETPYTHWVSDLTNAIGKPWAQRWHRHVVFVEPKQEQSYFITFDDIEVLPPNDSELEKVTGSLHTEFLWHFHAYEPGEEPRFGMDEPDSTTGWLEFDNARVSMHCDRAFEIEEGMLVAKVDEDSADEISDDTGVSTTSEPEEEKAFQRARIGLAGDETDAGFLAVYQTKPDDAEFEEAVFGEGPSVSFRGVTIDFSGEEGLNQIGIDLDLYRTYALQDHPHKLPPLASAETGEVFGYPAKALIPNTDFSHDAWMHRWELCGSALVAVDGGTLQIQKPEEEANPVAVLWLRSEFGRENRKRFAAELDVEVGEIINDNAFIEFILADNQHVCEALDDLEDEHAAGGGDEEWRIRLEIATGEVSMFVGTEITSSEPAEAIEPTTFAGGTLGMVRNPNSIELWRRSEDGEEVKLAKYEVENHNNTRLGIHVRGVEVAVTDFRVWKIG